MTLASRLILIAMTAQLNFSDVLAKQPAIFDDRVHLDFIDDTFMEIQYPIDTKYSFHWQRDSEIFRVDTAPHHKNIATYPRHMHEGAEDNVIEDMITSLDNSLEENVKKVLAYVRSRLAD